MNENEIGRIAAAVNCLRPDWPIASLKTLLGRPELVHRPRRDAAVALTWIACESDTKTPARVIEAGPWWKASAAEGGEDRRWSPPKSNEACGKHPGEHRDRCRSCIAEQIAGERDEEIERMSREAALEWAKAEARASRVKGPASASEQIDSDAAYGELKARHLPDIKALMASPESDDETEAVA